MRHVFCLLASLLCTFLVFDVSAQGEYAAPESGEGISAFLERNKRPGKAYYNELIGLDEERLREKEELRLEVRYMPPPLEKRASATVSSKPAADRKGIIRERLFGRRLVDVEVTSNRLQGVYFHMVGGHGGSDLGAIDKIGEVESYEDKYAYDVTLRLAYSLMQEGAEVRVITQDTKDGIRDDHYLSNSKREACMGDAIPLSQVARLQQRCTKTSELYRKNHKIYKCCRAVFLRIGNRNKSVQTGVFFYHIPKNVLRKGLAVVIKETFESKYGKHQSNRRFEGMVNSRNLYVLLKVTSVSVFVELGNTQNAFDQRRLVTSPSRQALVK